jgi:ligand-binding sensor domain-containing protein
MIQTRYRRIRQPKPAPQCNFTPRNCLIPINRLLRRLQQSVNSIRGTPMRSRFAALLSLLSAATLTGCIAGITYNATPVAPAAATFLYTTADASTTAGSINTYPAASTGNAVAASSSVPVNGTNLGGIHGDGAGNIYLLTAPYNTNNLTVSVYSATAGVLTLTRSFTYTAPVFSFTVDPTGIVYIAQGRGVILKFAANATGAATPTVITTNSTFSTMATDAAGDLFGYSNGVVTEFLAGDTSSARFINLGSNLNSASVTDMALDAAGNIYIAGAVGSTPTIFEYPSTGGPVSAIKTISGSSTLFGTLQAIYIDAVGNIDVEDASSSSNPHTSDIFIFPSTATGNVAPTSHFATAITTTASTGSTGLVAY